MHTLSETRQHGFTLIEVLVVMLIIGLMLGFVTLSVSTGGAERQGEEEARRLAALVELGRQEAVLRYQELAIEFRPDSYRFLRLDEDKWTAMEDDELLRQRELPAGITLSLAVDGEPVKLEAKPEEPMPQLFLLSSGEASPFVVTLTTPDHTAEWRIEGAEDAAVTIESVNGG